MELLPLLEAHSCDRVISQRLDEFQISPMYHFLSNVELTRQQIVGPELLPSHTLGQLPRN